MMLIVSSNEFGASSTGQAPAIQAIIGACRQEMQPDTDTKVTTLVRQDVADATKSMTEDRASDLERWHAAGGEHPVSS